jgi:transposase
MGRKTLQLKNYTSEQIKELIRTDDRYTIGIRLYAVYQLSLGQSSRKLQELFHTSFKQITNWAHQFDNMGLEGLRDKPRSGRNPRLDEDQMEQIKQWIVTQRPEEFGYNTSTWTGPVLIDRIHKEWGVKYKKAQIYNLLKKLGLSYQKGRAKYPETTQQQKQAFKKVLKKTPEKS